MIAYAPERRGSTVTATQEIGWIDNDAALARLVAALAHTSIAAVDTEFVREKTYYPQLCLIQIGTGEQVACIDCLAGLDLDAALRAAVRSELHVGAAQRAAGSRGRSFSSRAACRRGSSTRRSPRRCTGYPPQVGPRGIAETHARRRARRELRAHRLEPAAAARSRRCATRSTTFAICSRPGSGSTPSSAGSAAANGCARTASACSPSSPSRTRRRCGRASKACTGCRSRRSARRSRSCAGAKRRRSAAIGRGAGCSPTTRCSRSRRRCRATPTRSRRSPTRSSSRAALRPCSRRSRRATTPSCKPKCARTPRKPMPDKTLVKSLQERVRQHAAVLGIEPEILATKRDLVGVALGDPPLHLRTGWRAKELAPILERVHQPVSARPRSRAHRRSRDRREYVPVGCVRDVLSPTLPGASVCATPRAPTLIARGVHPHRMQRRRHRASGLHDGGVAAVSVEQGFRDRLRTGMCARRAPGTVFRRVSETLLDDRCRDAMRRETSERQRYFRPRADLRRE